MPDSGQQERAQTCQRLADQAVERFPFASLESLAVDLEVDAVEHPETSATAIAIAAEILIASSSRREKVADVS